MAVLVCLAEHAPDPVPKEKLLQQVWPDTFVGEGVLTRSISELRRVFEDDAKEPRVIQTIPKRGYRLVARVATVDEMAEDSPAAPRTPPAPGGVDWGKRWRLTALAMGGLLLLASLLVALNTRGLRTRFLGRGREPAIRSLAVLPLQNLSADPAQDYFSDGLTDALITDLARFGSVRIVSRTSIMRYKGTTKSLPEIARELNVDGIVEGTVQRFGDRVLITAQLIQSSSDKHLWARSYERDTHDVFALEREVTGDIAHQIQAQLSPSDDSGRAQPLPMDAQALEAYLQGNYHLNKQGKGFGDEEKRTAASYFQKAIAADPTFAPAYDGLVYSHELLLLGSRDDVTASRKAAEKAAEIDPSDWHARVLLAALKWQPDLDWRGAEEGYRQAIALNSNAASPRSALCILLVVLGRTDEGLRECRIAQRLDPLDDDSAVGLYLGRDYDDSIVLFRILLQRDPDVGIWHCDLFANYAQKGMYNDAIQELIRCYSLYGQPKAAANIHRAFQFSGYRGAIRQWAQETERLQVMHQAFLPGNLAQAYTILGDRDRAFYWLEQAYERRAEASFDGGVFFLSAEPMYDPLRSDPRFQDLLRRVGLLTGFASAAVPQPETAR